VSGAGSGKDRKPFKPVLSTRFKEDLAYWQATDPKLAKRLMRIVEETVRSPFTGLGKPEALRGDLSGYWSRRLTQEHRVVYLVTDTTVEFARAYGHY
jgi:toxin YoeB